MQEAVAGIVLRQNAVLLIKRRDIPVWVLPGGGIDPGETPEQAALREMQEETGYTVSLVRKIAEYSPANRFSQVTHVFECQILSGESATGPETAAVDFFSLMTLPKHMPPFYRHWLDDAISNHPYVLQKKIQGTSYWDFLKSFIKHPLLVGRYIGNRLQKCASRPYTKDNVH